MQIMQILMIVADCNSQAEDVINARRVKFYSNNKSANMCYSCLVSVPIPQKNPAEAGLLFKVFSGCWFFYR
jgi:hypothetical protein